MNDKGCDTCKYGEYTYECTIGRATECHWMNSFRLWRPFMPEDEYDSCSSSTTSTSSSSSWVPPEEHEEFSEEEFNVR